MFTGYAKFVELMKRIEVQDDSPIIQYTWQFFDDDPGETSGGNSAFTVEIQTSSNGTQFLYFQSEEANFITLLDGFPAVLYPGGYVVPNTEISIPYFETRHDVNGTLYTFVADTYTGEDAGSPGAPTYVAFYVIDGISAVFDTNSGQIFYALQS